MSQQNQNLKQRLIEGLNQIPESWALTPLLGNKAPYRAEWQHETPIPRSQIKAALADGEIVTYTKEDGSSYRKRIFPQGFGIRTGVISGGIVAVDLDGSSAHPYMLELSGGEELPPTVAFTSGRPGRRQYLFRVPEQYWQGIQTKKYKTGVKGDDGKPEQVELRWDGCQSVLPPSVHPTTGQYRWVEGCASWEREIAPAPLRLIELMLKDQTVAEQQQQPSISATEPLTPRRTLISSPTQSWTDIDWALCYLNALSPGRADDYDDWLAVGMALHSVDDSLLIEWDSWSRQSSKYKAGDCERKWKSFKRTGVSIGSLAHMAKQDGWRSPFSGKQRSDNGNGDGVNYPTGRGFGTGNSYSSSNGGAKTDTATRTLCDRVREILNRYDQESLQVNALMDLADASARTYNEVAQLARIIRGEGELADEVIETVNSFGGLLKSCRKRLDIKRYLEPALAQPLLDKAKAMPTAPEYLFNTLLAVVASLIGTTARIIINSDGGYFQPCVFWTANVAHSGQAKTPPQQQIVYPLEEMEAVAKENYDMLLEDYEQDQDKEARPPVRQRRILNNATTSTKIRIHGENPRGLLEYIDEMVADYQRLNQYKGGKGDDLQLELSFWNGSGGNFDRSDARLFLKRTALSKTGTYQWDTLARLMGDEVNFIASGYSARFLYCSIMDAPPRYLDLLSSPGEDTLTDKLHWLYSELEKLPYADYLLDHEAKVLFQGWNHVLVNAEVEEAHYGLSLIYAKIESYTARLALWLHIVNALLRGEKPAPVISGETMQHAIEIASFYLWQHKLIHAHNSPTRKLEGIFLKVQTLAEKFFSKSGKGVGASFLKSRINALKGWVVEKIRSTVFKALVSAGHGRIEGEGSDMVYIPNTVPGDIPPDEVGGRIRPNGYGGPGGANEPGGPGGAGELGGPGGAGEPGGSDGIGEVGGIGGELVVPPIAESHTKKGIQTAVGEIGDIRTPNLSSKKPSSMQEFNSNPESNHQFTNSMAEPVIGSELQPIGDHQNAHQSAHIPPTLDPLGGDGGSPVPSAYKSPSGNDGGELLSDDEMAALHSCLNACQTLNDAVDFYAALDALSPRRRHQFESQVPIDRWAWLWNLPEATEQEPSSGVPGLLELEPELVVEPESKLELEPTLEELKALLLTCDSLVQLNELKRKHKKTIALAYNSMSDVEQTHVDAIAALAVPYKVFKYLGEEIKQGTERLMRGMLVYIDVRFVQSKPVREEDWPQQGNPIWVEFALLIPC